MAVLLATLVDYTWTTIFINFIGYIIKHVTFPKLFIATNSFVIDLCIWQEFVEKHGGQFWFWEHVSCVCLSYFSSVGLLLHLSYLCVNTLCCQCSLAGVWRSCAECRVSCQHVVSFSMNKLCMLYLYVSKIYNFTILHTSVFICLYTYLKHRSNNSVRPSVRPSVRHHGTISLTLLRAHNQSILISIRVILNRCKMSIPWDDSATVTSVPGNVAKNICVLKNKSI